AMPDGLMRELGAVLERLPQVTLDKLEWRLTADPAHGNDDALPPLRAELIAHAHLPDEFGAQQRRALEVVDALAGQLRARPGLDVQV
ncbi:UNVERIFIED_CONTAM: hypothetical protein IGO34_32500, partial [Salmonella enterica subsp. enterica serovar Weltevreden]